MFDCINLNDLTIKKPTLKSNACYKFLIIMGVRPLGWLQNLNYVI